MPSSRLRLAYLAHTFRSDWNNGNAHFLRGLLRSLAKLGHVVTGWEPADEWSLTHLRAEPRGKASLAQFDCTYPDLDIRSYVIDPQGERLQWRERLRESDVVILHEWNPPALAQLLLQLRDELGFKLLFHDTHHRASSSPESFADFGLDRFDGVLAFGEALRAIYRERFGLTRVWTLHEAADTKVFAPYAGVPDDLDVVWIGNWGEGERSDEIRRFLLEPVATLKQGSPQGIATQTAGGAPSGGPSEAPSEEPSEAPSEGPGKRQVRSTPQTQSGMQQLKAGVYGVRYPPEGLGALAAAGVEYRGYLPNLEAPRVYAGSRLTVHIPRQQYSQAMHGIPTIRVFEALACGIPLLSAPWQDTEQLFRPGDFTFVHSTAEMTDAMHHLLADREAAATQAARGLETILAHHTCDHRARELTAILTNL